MNWKEIVNEKRNALRKLIPDKWLIPDHLIPLDSQRSVVAFCRESGLLTDEELTITELAIRELAQKISTGQYTAANVCQAYCHRAAIAHQLVNCLAEICFDAALEQAKELDNYFQKHGKTIGLFHGVPISLKDQFRVKGLESGIGYVSFLGQPDQEESVLTECLRRAGAIIYVKTTVPQSLLIGETESNLYGTTVNPYNRLLSCGGSSGGEGTLVSLYGSGLGVGTDVGGSIRIPAAFNSLWSLKPSHGRLPFGNIRKTVDGNETIPSVCGPLGHSIGDLVYFMQAILQQEPWMYDPKVIEIGWRNERYLNGKTGKKTFGVIAVNGIFGFDGVVMPHPPILRGIQQVIVALRNAGHTVVEWIPHKHMYGASLLRTALATDGGEAVRRALALSGEPPIPQIQGIVDSNKPPVDLATLWKIQNDKNVYQTEYLLVWQKRSHIDAWILPVAPYAAVRPNGYDYYGYTTVLNLLDWPSVTIPVTFADKAKDTKDFQYRGANELDTKVSEGYDPDLFHGAPVGVQVVGKRLQEEYLLGLAEQIGEALSMI